MIRGIVLVFLMGIALSCYVNKQNEEMRLKLAIPRIVQEIKGIKEKNTELRYQIEQFESPENLMELARREEFSHLKHPFFSDILTLREGVAVHLTPPFLEEGTPFLELSKPTLASVQ